MVSLGFVNQVSNQRRATLESLKSIREFYPKAPVAVICDAGDDFSDICAKYDCAYVYNTQQLGYPQQPYGYGWKILEWLRRFRAGFDMCDADYICMWEDDGLLLAPIEINPEWECVGHVLGSPGNWLPEELLLYIKNYSHKFPATNYYSTGGWSIFKRSIMQRNYSKINDLLEKELGTIMNYYPTAGWLDCIMTIFYQLAGSSYHTNPQLLNLWPNDYTTTPEELKQQYLGKYSIIHNWKYWYDKKCDII